MRTRALALSAIILVTALTLLPTVALAQYHPRPLPQNPTNPTNPVNPGTHRPEPTTIVIPTPPPYGVTQESSIIDLNTGTITIIQQTGNETFVTTY